MRPLLIYLAIGGLMHACFVGVTLNPANLMTWLWLLAWPILFLLKVSAAVLSAIVLVLVCLGCYYIFDKVLE